MDELLVKYLLNETSEEESAQVLQWIAASDANAKYFSDFKAIWDKSKNLQQQSDLNVDAAWSSFQSRIAGSSANKILPFEKRNRKWQIPLAAASVLIIIAAGLFFFFNHNNHTTLYAKNIVITDTLPDGSVVILNKNASVTFAKDFNKTKRDITLKGEAFFKVSPNKQKPFIIKTGDIFIRVVGTSFNVKNSKWQTEVIVETGIVNVKHKNEQLNVLPQQKIIVRNDSKALHIEQNEDSLYNYYRTNEFVCNNTPLYRLTDAMSTAFNTKITIADSQIAQQRFSTTFKNMNIDDMLGVICTTFHLTAKKNSTEIILQTR